MAYWWCIFFASSSLFSSNLTCVHFDYIGPVDHIFKRKIPVFFISVAVLFILDDFRKPFCLAWKFFFHRFIFVLYAVYWTPCIPAHTTWIIVNVNRIGFFFSTFYPMLIQCSFLFFSHKLNKCQRSICVFVCVCVLATINVIFLCW